MLHLEPFIDAATDSLRKGLGARIDAINGETGDFDLEKPDDDAYVPGGVAEVYKVPMVEIAAPDWNIGNPTVGQREWEGDYTLMVRVWYQHPDFNILYRSLMRYGRALVEVLSEPDALGPHTVISSMRGAYRVNPELSERIEFEGGALVVCEFQTVELAP